MFESIMVRRTTPMGAPAAVDLGRLAEAMLFYQRVHLTLTRASLHQFILGAGPDLAIELVENGCVDAVFLDRDFAVLNEGVGTPNERHQPATITVMTEVPGGEPRAQTRQDLVYEFFNQALDG
jgi:ABC-type amino acid transport substrate-binding protein